MLVKLFFGRDWEKPLLEQELAYRENFDDYINLFYLSLLILTQPL